MLFCVTILLLLEVGVARRDWAWRLDPRRPVGIFLAVEEQIVAPATDPRVVVLGSSVMRDAVIPAVLEGAASLPAGSLLNTSLPNATPFDFVTLYRRNRTKLGEARLLLVGVEDWYFYEEPGVSERYQRWASLSQRLGDYRGGDRLRLVVSWLWQTYAARQALAVDGMVAALRGRRAEVIGTDRRVKWRPEEQATGAASFDLTSYEARLRERAWEERQVPYLVEVARLAVADGVPVVLVRMPMRATALRLREVVDPGAESRLQTVLERVRSEAPAVVLDIPTGETIGIPDVDFLDERHLGTEGAALFSRYLAEWAASRYPLR